MYLTPDIVLAVDLSHFKGLRGNQEDHAPVRPWKFPHTLWRGRREPASQQ